ncbi:MAG: vitamin B12 receptor [Burkholderiales bacterium RIFCSPLOWO2_02_FULL_57_36]|nr:MAG: vitamin B12 receptor [Burkholderiales bacterium RIFCSPLOWO2_02_FULL_57_36]
MTFTVSRHVTLTIKPLALAIAIAAAFPSLTFAQTGQDTMLAPVVVTATRSAQAARDIITDNIVITSEEIAQSGFASLPDLLQRKRGIEISRNGGPGTNASVFIRGTNNNQSIVLIDGVRIGSSTSGGATWQTIPLSQIDHIEIVYGPMSTMYGADAVGGVIQIFTKAGDGAPRVTASAGAGSYDTRSLEAGVSGATGGEHRFSYAIGAAHEKSEGFSATKSGAFGFNPDQDGYQRDSASGRFTLDVAKGHELGLTFLSSRLDSQFDNGSSAFDARNIIRLGSYALHSKNRLLPNWTSRVQLARSIDKAESLTSTGTGIFDTTQNHLNWQNDLTLGSDVLQLVLERREEKAASTVAEVARTRDTNSAAASYLLKRGSHLGNLAIRNDRSSQFGSHTSGSIGYGYRITQALRASTSVGTSFRAPTFNELYFPGFGSTLVQPEEGKNAEIGLYYEGKKTQLSAVYYRNRLTNLIVNGPCPASTGFCASNVNKALLTGISLGASTRLGSFTARGSLDIQEPRDETTEKILTRRARQHGSVALEYNAGAVRSGIETVFSGKRFENTANTVRLGGYGIVNLYGSYDFARNWSVFGRWNNVFDKNYEVARNYATPGSNLFVGVNYGFN